MLKLGKLLLLPVPSFLLPAAQSLLQPVILRTSQALCFAVLLAVVSVADASLVVGTIDAITNAATCAICHTLFVPLMGLAALGDKPFTDTHRSSQSHQCISTIVYPKSNSDFFWRASGLSTTMCATSCIATSARSYMRPPGDEPSRIDGDQTL